MRHHRTPPIVCLALLALCACEGADDGAEGFVPPEDAGAVSPERPDFSAFTPPEDAGPPTLDARPEEDATPPLDMGPRDAEALDAVVNDADVSDRPDADAPDQDVEGVERDGGGPRDAALLDGAMEDMGAAPGPLVRVHALDIWARPLKAPTLTVRLEGVPVEAARAGVVWSVEVSTPASLSLRLSAPEHEDVEAEITLDDVSGVLEVVPSGEGRGLAWVVTPEGVDVYLGAAHSWFSAQGPPPKGGNRLTLLADGEAAWLDIAERLGAAVGPVLISTWWWESDFELLRPWPAPSEAAREANTILGVLRGVQDVRVLVGELWGDNDLLDRLTLDGPLRALAEAPGDGFEAMGQGNATSGRFWFEVTPVDFGRRLSARLGIPTLGGAPVPSVVPARWVDLTDIPGGFEFQIASYHQKFFVVDDAVAYVGGMNLTGADWDTSAHEVFDPRRMPFDADEADRVEVSAGDEASEYTPAKDYMLKVEGPLALDVADVFRARWDLLRAEGVRYAEATTPLPPSAAAEAWPEGSVAQITTTLPEPLWAHSIAESWLNAVARAERYIYIEDQYWRAPMLTDAILARMEAVPDLHLVVITQPVDPVLNPACVWTHRTDEAIRRRFPDRYHLFQLKSFATTEWGIGDETEGHFVDLYLHAKMLVVDDRFMSVGSANKNNRGMVYEGEMNVAVLDDAWVRAAHKRMLRLLLPPGVAPADTAAGWIAQLRTAATHNGAVLSRWEEASYDIDLGVNGALDPLPAIYTPRGFLYPLELGAPEDCLIEGVGPDIFSR